MRLSYFQAVSLFYPGCHEYQTHFYMPATNYKGLHPHYFGIHTNKVGCVLHEQTLQISAFFDLNICLNYDNISLMTILDNTSFLPCQQKKSLPTLLNNRVRGFLI